MNNRNLVLGAFFIEGTDKYFFGLRDAKNYQLVKGGNIRGPHGKMIQADPFPNAKKCMNCENRVTPTGALLGAPMEELPTKCSDCNGSWAPKSDDALTQASIEKNTLKKKKRGFFNFFQLA